MSASAAPAQAPAHRPATSADHDPLLRVSGGHEAPLSKDDQSRSIDDARAESMDDACIDEGCIAEECAEAEPL